MARDDRTHRYPAGWLVPTVDAEDWISIEDAARELGMSRLRVAHLGTKVDLEQASHPDGRAGFTRASVTEFARWRAEASLGLRLLRSAAGWIRFL